ncbi:lauroyl acyltransferase [Prolixibacteraceae bacterium JC049]|nr:lauroyl acyltransferase [Prolixibacteraceae bacterium JC049]
MEHWWIFILGFFAQILFFARVTVQWFMSEKSGKVVSPVIFWQISVIASLLLLWYGILRNDFAIVLGQLAVYFIYIRNLQLQRQWTKLPNWFKVFAWTTPGISLIWMLLGPTHNFSTFFNNQSIPTTLLVWGSLGQLTFTLRFIYQWIYSEKQKQSELPIGFWIISLVGAAMIFSYGIIRLDPVLITGQSFGLIVYTRNLMLCMDKRSKLMTKVSTRVINSLPQK